MMTTHAQSVASDRIDNICSAHQGRCPPNCHITYPDDASPCQYPGCHGSGDVHIEECAYAPRPHDAQTLACFVCGRPLLSALPPDLRPETNQPSGAVAFSTRGHYGSVSFDPMNGETLEINICDPCLDQCPEKIRHLPRPDKARLDADGTADPKTSLHGRGTVKANHLRRMVRQIEEMLETSGIRIEVASVAGEYEVTISQFDTHFHVVAATLPEAIARAFDEAKESRSEVTDE